MESLARLETGILLSFVDGIERTLGANLVRSWTLWECCCHSRVNQFTAGGRLGPDFMRCTRGKKPDLHVQSRSEEQGENEDLLNELSQTSPESYESSFWTSSIVLNLLVTYISHICSSQWFNGRPAGLTQHVWKPHLQISEILRKIPRSTPNWLSSSFEMRNAKSPMRLSIWTIGR